MNNKLTILVLMRGFEGLLNSEVICICFILFFWSSICYTGVIEQSISEETLDLPVRGGDISFLPQIEDNGGKFFLNGTEEDLLVILRNHGINSIRLRIWNDPLNGYCDKEKTLALAKRLKSLDFHFLLNFHYSDNWADPGQQSKPSNWTQLAYKDLKVALYNYTKEVITDLKNQGTLPDMVQIGNEITCGMLWDDGRICDRYNNDSQWSRFTDLLKTGIQGVQDSIENESIKIMVHIDRGGDNFGSRWFFDNIKTKNVTFDIIGLSYYPWWHGGLEDLKTNLEDLASRYEKELCIVEIAYPWTLNWHDSTHNLVGLEEQLLDGYPATVGGQKKFLLDVITIIKDVPLSKGLGLYYWAPEWVSTPSFGSAWENVALFDFSGNALDSMGAFKPSIISTSSTIVSTESSTIGEISTTQASTHGFKIIGLVSIFVYIFYVSKNRKKH